ncbi:UNVERIFIED_CONTAM: hypothetical protein PYX00_009534 [Menopon gallinae]|uniref:STAS domain-containing protein n=1 Tax=Menopon gallinae TaxID=328185 RepID=A0AAW2HBN4_9NEOP
MDPEVHGKYNPRPSEAAANEVNKETVDEERFRQMYQYQPEVQPGIAEKVKSEVKCSGGTIFNLFPILRWLPRYRKEDVLPDMVAGLTVAVMHIPQGMAYALLGGVPPVVGIYMALFPVFVYILMGTSPHVSMGTFAVVSMMVGKCVQMYAVSEETGPVNGTEALTPVQVAATVSLSVGLWQVVFGLLKLGSLSVFLSGTLVSGFTTGAAVHVFTSQVKSLLGIRVKRFSGPFKIIYTYIEIFSKIKDSNYVAVLLSGSVILLLGLYNEFVKPLIQKKMKRNIPIPVELMIVVIGTVISTQFHLKEEHGIEVVDSVPTGLPSPAVPIITLLPKVLVDGLVIGIVAIAINLSMANIFARKMGYRIDGNQEVLASGAGNVFGSFFSCMPYAASLSRSLIQQSVGARTQITNVFSCIVLVLVLLFIAPFFEPLPYCVLSAIIVIALKGMFLQFKDLVSIAKLSKLDGFVWLATFLSVVILDVDYGLGIGLIASVCCLLYRSQNAQAVVLGRIPGTHIYKDRKAYKKAESVAGAIILEVVGGLHFANAETVRNLIIGEVLHSKATSIVLVQDTEKPVRPPNLILKMSSVAYMDPSAVKCLKSTCEELARMNCICLLCECSPSLFDTLKRCSFFGGDFPVGFVFPTVAHAVEYLDRVDVPGSSKAIFHIV